MARPGSVARAWAWLTQQPKDRRTGLQITAVVLVVVSVLAVFMVLAGNRLMGEFLVAVLGPDGRVQFAAGFLWATAAWALCLHSDQVRTPKTAHRMQVAGGLMWFGAFLVSPVGRIGGAEGAGAYAPHVALGVLLGVPVSGGVFWLLRRPLRARRTAEERARLDQQRSVQDFRCYRGRLQAFGGDVRKTDDSFRQEHLANGVRIPSRPPEVTQPDTSAVRFDGRGNRLVRRKARRRG